MRDKLSEFFFGTVVLSGPWCLAWRFAEIFVVLSILVGLWQQFSS